MEMSASEGSDRVVSAAAGDSREKILAAAELLFARRGYAGVGMREVAEAVGLGKSSLFHHFRGKLALYEEVLARVLVRLAARVRPTLKLAGSPAERLELWSDALVEALAEHPHAARLCLRSILEEDPFPPQSQRDAMAFEEVLAELVQGFQRLVVEGVESGAFRPVSLAEITQTMIGITVYPFASGAFGESLLGGPLFASESVLRRKQEVRRFLNRGLAMEPSPTPASNSRS